MLPLLLLIRWDGGGHGPVLTQSAAPCRNCPIRSDLLVLAVVVNGSGVRLLLQLGLWLLLTMAAAIADRLTFLIASYIAVAAVLRDSDGWLDSLGREVLQMGRGAALWGDLLLFWLLHFHLLIIILVPPVMFVSISASYYDSLLFFVLIIYPLVDYYPLLLGLI